MDVLVSRRTLEEIYTDYCDLLNNWCPYGQSQQYLPTKEKLQEIIQKAREPVAEERLGQIYREDHILGDPGVFIPYTPKMEANRKANEDEAKDVTRNKAKDSRR